MGLGPPAFVRAQAAAGHLQKPQSLEELLANSGQAEPKDGGSSGQIEENKATPARGSPKTGSTRTPPPLDRPAKSSRPLSSTPSSFAPFKKQAQLPRAREALPSSGQKQAPPKLHKAPLLKPSASAPITRQASESPKSSPMTGTAQAEGGSKRGRPVDHSISSRSAPATEGQLAELQELWESLQVARAQADQAQLSNLLLMQMMREAETLLRQQAGAGLEGVAAIYGTAGKLVSSNMLLHLPTTKAHMLANLQVEIKLHASTILDALNNILSLTGPAQETPHAESGQKRQRPNPPAPGPQRRT